MASYQSYLNKLKTISRLEMRCRSCGAYMFSLQSIYECFCCFCESYTDATAHSIDSDQTMVDAMTALNKAILDEEWLVGIKYADQLAATKKPYALYGAASFYSAFSDYTYNDVNYALEGFMYENANKRSDDFAKNKYNAMALTSKSREYFYKVLKITSDSKAEDEDTLYLEFITNVKLGRRAQAAIAMNKMLTQRKGDIITQYTEMVYNETMGNKKAMQGINQMLNVGQVNSLYYLAHHLAKEKAFGASKRILEELKKATGLSMAPRLLNKIQAVENAMSKA